MTVLVLTSEEDVTADMVINCLVKLAVPVMRVDPEHFPGRVDLAARVTAGGELSGRITTDRRSVELTDIRSIWRRRPGPPGHLATEQRPWVSLECERALYGVLRGLPAPWMNHPGAIERSHYKAWQLQLARSVGLRTPDTLFTTVPADAERFAADAGPLIVKSVSGRHPEDPPMTLQTHRVPPGASFAGIADSATCLQSEITKHHDVRLTVVGDQMFPCHIRPRSDAVDWRFEPESECSWRISDIPQNVEQAVRRYMTAAGLVYAAFDFAVDHGGRYWFLEANANGQFGFIELQTGAQISQSIAAWLASPPT
ncbi:MvdC/MvdD family ATP grasp protein [Streptomyces griseofuscus]|uniref:MvdC/MvdD family ATP grasp protein n=1 Tax=Streptomyces griseofuscus TaxID=146922 RepID=UPI00368FDBB0